MVNEGEHNLQEAAAQPFQNANAVTSAPTVAIPEFQPNSDEWILYQERLENYFGAYDITTEAKRKVTLLNSIGPKAYKLVRDICSPDTPNTKSYAQLCKILKDYYTQPVIAYKERKDFYSLIKTDGESCVEWMARVKCCASNCDFAEKLTGVVLDKFVTGQSGRIFERLCEENHSTLTLERALELASKYEAQKITSQSVNAISKYSTKKQQKKPDESSRSATSHNAKPKQNKKVKCSHCGYSNHQSDQCKFKDATCVRCNKTGHIATVCKQSKSINCVDTERETTALQYSDAIFNIYSEEINTSPIFADVQVNGIQHKFMLDTGAGISAIPNHLYVSKFKNLKLEKSFAKIFDYSSNQIKVIGSLNPNVKFMDKTLPLRIIVVESQGPPILGRDFIRKFEIDSFKVNLISTLTLKDLLHKFKTLFDGQLGKFKYHKIHIDIDPLSKPIFCKPRQIPFAFRDRVDILLDEYIQSDLITKIETSEWGTPLVPVLKSDGGIRICADYKVTINKHLKPNLHPLPRIEDIFNSLQGGVTFTKLDMPNAFNQFELDEESRKLVVWSTQRGVFTVNRLPFGIKPATGIFQSEMEKLLQGIPGVVNFVDDIVVTGPNQEAHLANLFQVFKRLSDAGLKLRMDKCVFFQKEITFLGHRLNGNGLSKTIERVEAITEAPVPKNVTEVRAFTGLINYYGKFIKGLAHLLSPIYRLLEKGQTFNWNSNCQKSFDSVKNEILKDVVLTHFNPKLPIILVCDASQYGIGAVLSHKFPNGDERPIAFCSRTLTKAEINYGVIEKEALAIVFAVRKFFQYLIGFHFTLQTDHKPLLGLFGEATGLPQMAASRIQRWAIFLSAFNYTLQYVKGENNVADTFSRLPIPNNSIEPVEKNYINYISDRGIEIDHKRIKFETARDPVLSKVYIAIQNGTLTSLNEEVYKPFVKREKELSIEQGAIMWGYRIVIPFKLHEIMLDSLHSSHMGIVKCKSLARSYFWFPGIDAKIEVLIKSCKACLSVRSDPPKAQLIPWTSAGQTWSRVHTDFAGPMDGNYYFIITDSYSKWVEVFKTKTITAEFTVSKLREVFTRFGLVDTIVSDNGTQFTSQHFKEFVTINGIKHITIPVCHPATNGAAENAVRSFKNGLKSAIYHASNTNQTKDLDTLILRYVFDYRITPHSTTGISPAKLMFGRELRSRFDLLRPQTVDSKIQKVQNRQTENYSGSRDAMFDVGDKVNIKDTSVNNNRWLPAIIEEVRGPRSYTCKILGGRSVHRHLNQIIKRTEPNDNSIQNTTVPTNIVSINTPKIKRNINTNNDIVKHISEPLNVSDDEDEFFDAVPNPIDKDTDNLTLDQNQIDLDLRPLFEQCNQTKVNDNVHVRPKRTIKKPEKLNL